MNTENRLRWLSAKERQQQTLAAAQAAIVAVQSIVHDEPRNPALDAAFAAADAAIAARWQADGEHWDTFAAVHGL